MLSSYNSDCQRIDKSNLTKVLGKWRFVESNEVILKKVQLKEDKSALFLGWILSHWSDTLQKRIMLVEPNTVSFKDLEGNILDSAKIVVEGGKILLVDHFSKTENELVEQLELRKDGRLVLKIFPKDPAKRTRAFQFVFEKLKN